MRRKRRLQALGVVLVAVVVLAIKYRPMVTLGWLLIFTPPLLVYGLYRVYQQDTI